MPRHQVILMGIVAIVAAAAGVMLSREMMNRPPSQDEMTAGTIIQPPRSLPNVEMLDQDSKPFDAKRLQGRWSFLFFGFTNCPDLCPATLTVLAQIEKRLQDLPPSDRPHVVLVSVDPKRDTPEQLKKYVRFFSPAFEGVTGTPERIEAFTREMGVPVAIQQHDNGAYTVDHSGAIFLIDPQGAMHALFSTPHDVTKIADDYRRIVGA